LLYSGIISGCGGGNLWHERPDITVDLLAVMDCIAAFIGASVNDIDAPKAKMHGFPLHNPTHLNVANRHLIGRDIVREPASRVSCNDLNQLVTVDLLGDVVIVVFRVDDPNQVNLRIVRSLMLARDKKADPAMAARP
jgi:hypothetical protein